MNVFLKIPVYFTNDDTDTKVLTQEEHPMHEYSIRMVTFYNIDVLVPEFDEQDGDREYCRIISGGNQFTTPMTMTEINKAIHEVNQVIA